MLVRFLAVVASELPGGVVLGLACVDAALEPDKGYRPSLASPKNQVTKLRS